MYLCVVWFLLSEGKDNLERSLDGLWMVRATGDWCCCYVQCNKAYACLWGCNKAYACLWGCNKAYALKRMLLGLLLKGFAIPTFMCALSFFPSGVKSCICFARLGLGEFISIALVAVHGCVSCLVSHLQHNKQTGPTTASVAFLLAVRASLDSAGTSQDLLS